MWSRGPLKSDGHETVCDVIKRHPERLKDLESDYSRTFILLRKKNFRMYKKFFKKYKNKDHNMKKQTEVESEHELLELYTLIL